MDYLREHGLKLTLIIMILAVLSPSALPKPYFQPLAQMQSAISFGRFDQALSSLEQARKFEPASPGLHETSFLLALQLGKWDEAQAQLDQLSELNMRSEAITCGSIQLALARNEEAKIINIDPQALASCPQAEEALHKLASELYESGKFESAVPLLENLMQFGQESEAESLMLALYWATMDPLASIDRLRATQSGQSPDALLALELLITIQDFPADQPESILAAQVGQSFLRESKEHLALLSFDRAVSLDPGFAQAWGYLGVVKNMLGQDGGPDLARAVDLAPDDPLLLVMQAAYLNLQDQAALALPLLEQAASLDPENPAIAAELGQSYILLGDLESARLAYRQATIIAPENAAFWILLGDFSITYEIDIDELAIPALRNALIHDPLSIHAWRSLGYAYHLQGNFALAKRALLRAIELAPSDPASQYYLGLLYQVNGLTEDAISAWKAALVSSPDHPYALLAQRALENLGPFR